MGHRDPSPPRVSDGSDSVTETDTETESDTEQGELAPAAEEGATHERSVVTCESTKTTRASPAKRATPEPAPEPAPKRARTEVVAGDGEKESVFVKEEASGAPRAGGAAGDSDEEEDEEVVVMLPAARQDLVDSQGITLGAGYADMEGVTCGDELVAPTSPAEKTDLAAIRATVQRINQQSQRRRKAQTKVSADVIINDCPFNARVALTRSATHTMIFKETGATVAPRGRFINMMLPPSPQAVSLMTQQQDMSPPPSSAAVAPQQALRIPEDLHLRPLQKVDLPLQLHITAETLEALEKAKKMVQMIIIFCNPKETTQSITASPIVDNVFVDFRAPESEFQLVGRLLGPQGVHMKRIADESGCTVWMAGLYDSGPLCIVINAPTREHLARARALAEAHITLVKQQYATFKQGTAQANPVDIHTPFPGWQNLWHNCYYPACSARPYFAYPPALAVLFPAVPMVAANAEGPHEPPNKRGEIEGQ
eukprot:TRINITY_DN6250_c0_g1_i2.p1 TRINITY_DN6250_c0_g1~~TRINITY_DN6250_c0_g1_i2.p1  ORF type:complete len:482 (-),score=83.09 TRINITY_DN6250_c0_g1_i2:77-1522(-)